MNIQYFIFGLLVQSNTPIPGLVTQEFTQQEIDLEISLNSQPDCLNQDLSKEAWLVKSVSMAKGDNDQPLWKIEKLLSESYLRLTYHDRTQFTIAGDGSKVWANTPEHLTVEDTATYLLGPILGFILRLRGITCLHASAVAIGEEAIAFVGDSGAGKSTTAAAFAQLGYPILSDDIVALVPKNDHFWVQPAYPRVRLWSSSVEMLFQSADALPRLVPTHPTWDKRYLDLSNPDYHFQEKPLPLRHIYFLSSRTTDPNSPYLEELSASSSLLKLITHTYANVLLDSKMRGEEFACLSQVVKQTDVSAIIPNSDSGKIMALCELVLNTLAQTI